MLSALIAGVLATPALAAPPPPPPPPPPQAAPVHRAAAPTGGPARIEADLGMLNGDQKLAMQTCLFEGARLAGIGGATEFKLIAMDSIEQGNGGWRFKFRTLKRNSGGERQGSAFCRATSSKVIEYSVS